MKIPDTVRGFFLPIGCGSSTGPPRDYIGVDYNGLIAPIISSIQELDQKVSEVAKLKEQLKAQQTEIDELKKLVNEIQKGMAAKK